MRHYFRLRRAPSEQTGIKKREIDGKQAERGDGGWLVVKYTQIITKREDGVSSGDLAVAATADAEWKPLPCSRGCGLHTPP